VAVAVHAGHGLRPEIEAEIALPEAVRLREEDPGTAEWAARFPTWLAAHRSRFEVDLNRPRDTAVYRDSEEAWGLDIWRRPLPAELAGRSLANYDAFYSVLGGILDRAQAAHGRFVVYDLHSYCHRRAGPGSPPADPAGHPDVNVGTGSMDRARWAPLVDRFIAHLGSQELPGRGALDVRENVCFKGRRIAQWVHERYPETGCALAIEVKKFYMDEHTGTFDERLTRAVGDALAGSVATVTDELGRLPV
ncbi:MAG TPA: N-formylglutamate amidohydrolase, partial [Acidimicrobiia bacterium]|nr:N-formylglutamate amidohydrolase [Acidimicrobiia bacterium]